MRARRRAGPGGRVRRRVLAGRRRDPPGRRADPARRRRQPDPPGDHRAARPDGRADRRVRRRRRPGRRDRRAGGRPDGPLERSSRRSTSRRPTWPPRSTRSRSSAWPRRQAHGRTTIRGAGELRHQGIGSDRRDCRRAGGARGPGDGRRRRPDDRRADRADRRGDRQPRRSPPGDDLRDRRPHRPGPHDDRRARTAPRSRIPASSASSRGYGHDQASRPASAIRWPTRCRARCSRPPSTSAGSMRPTSCGIAPRSSSPTAIDELRGDDFLGANVTIPHKEKVVPLVDRLTEEAHATGAVNTITREGKKLDRPQHRRARFQGRARQARRQAEDAAPGGRPRCRRRGTGGGLRADHRGLHPGHRVQPPPPPGRGAGQALRPERRPHGAQGDALARVDHRVRAGQDQASWSTRRRSACTATSRRSPASSCRPTCSCST